MKDRYIQMLDWFHAHPTAGYWISIVLFSFFVLLLVYLVITNLRLHHHIHQLQRDKQRLMEEKDLMRLGRSNPSEG